jgi:DNA mismatch repair protein MutS
VAICEQVSDPNLPGIVQREVVRIVTPGTTFSEGLLDTKSNHYTIALYPKRDYFGIATIDLTTGAFGATECRGYDQLANELQRLNPRECILPPDVQDPHLKTLLEVFSDLYCYPYASTQDASETLRKQLQIQNLESFGIEKWPFAIQAAGNLLNYLKDTQKSSLGHLQPLKAYTPDQYMLLDEATLRNLELVATLRENQKQGSLLGVLDHTQTAMGGRLLKQWIVRPLTHKAEIEERLDAVEVFYKNDRLREDLREFMAQILDIERVLSRLTLDRGSPRELVALKASLKILPRLKQQLQTIDSEWVRHCDHELAPLPELVELLGSALIDEPPMGTKDGGFIRDGFNAQLDELLTLSREGKGFIKTLQQKEIARTGIHSLKVKYNQVFGYYIEISKANLSKPVPDDYIRKQTLVNAERYITPELKEYEEKVLTAEEKSKALEYEIFKELREATLQHLRDIQQTAEAIAHLDVILTLAHVARKNNYHKPQLFDDKRLEIVGGRHPVVESMNPAGDFVPNDLYLNEDFDLKMKRDTALPDRARGLGACEEPPPAGRSGPQLQKRLNRRVMLLTGPNMSGKSTYLRQVALITLMAQMGSFVPAESAALGVVDRIFTRVGASDNLVRGQSTFMVEMQEAANILNNATDRSLVILDEIGRGTSTYDGVSIAWAMLEYLHDTIGAKTLFATHYHELIAVAEKLAHAVNASVAVEEDKERGVVFLHRIQEGGIDKSYGIEVAKLAGLPSTVIQRAKHILNDLEEGVVETGIKAQLQRLPTENQTELFDLGESEASMMAAAERSHGQLTHPALERLKQLDINRMTPLEALQTLEALQKGRDKCTFPPQQ